jgi:hypothetical protein
MMEQLQGFVRMRSASQEVAIRDTIYRFESGLDGSEARPYVAVIPAYDEAALSRTPYFCEVIERNVEAPPAPEEVEPLRAECGPTTPGPQAQPAADVVVTPRSLVPPATEPPPPMKPGDIFEDHAGKSFRVVEVVGKELIIESIVAPAAAA